MNKFLSRVIGASLGVAMMIGVAVGVANSKETNPVYATIDTANGYTAATMTNGTNGSAADVQVGSNTYTGVKVGTNSKGGDLTVTIPAGTTDLRFYAAAWKGVTGLSLNISKKSGAEDATISAKSVDLTADDGMTGNPNPAFILNGSEENYRFDLTLSGITSETVYKFETSAKKRFVMWSAQTKGALKQTISGSTAAYTNETVTLTTTAANPTWSIVTADTTAEGANVTDAGVVSVTGAGVVKVKAAADGYADAFHTITFSVKPTETFVKLDTETIIGYVGQKVVVQFTYGNLKTNLTVSSNDTSTATVSDLAYAEGKGSVQINLVGASTTAVKFYDGENELASIPVSVGASTVEIIGFPQLGILCVDETKEFGSTFIVNTTGAYSNKVIWSSSDEKIATVDQNGNVTGVAEGTVDITITSADDSSVSATCSVTVIRAQFKQVNEFINGKKYILGAGGKERATTTLYLSAGTNVVSKNPYVSSAFTLADFTDDMAWTANVTKVDDSEQIVFSNEYKGTTYYLNAGNKAQTISIDKSSNCYWTFDGKGLIASTSEGKYLACYDDRDVRQYADPEGNNAKTINKFYEYMPTPKQEVESMKTQTSLSYRYSKDSEGKFTFTDMNIRFGGTVSKDLWEALDTDEHKITGFGVVIADGSVVKTHEDLMEAVEMATPSTEGKDISTEIAVDYFVPAASKDSTIAEKGNDYYWNLRYSVADSDTNKQFVAVAYIKLGEEYVLMNEARESVETLALDYLHNRDCSETTAGGSLQALADRLTTI